MLKTLIRTAFAVLTIGTLESLRRQLACRPGDPCDTSAAPHEELTWEGEGGALPVTGSHLGPEPALPTH